MPDIDARTGNYFTSQIDDVYQSVNDRLRTPLGARLLLSGYGFPSDWASLDLAGLTAAAGQAIATEELADRYAVTGGQGAFIMDIESRARLLW